LHETPNDANANFLCSQVRNAFGDHSSPPWLAEKAVRLAPNVARYHRQLAEVQGVMAQHAGVLQQLLLARRFRKEIDTTLELDPKDVQASRDLLEFYLLAPGLAGGDPAKADSMARRIGMIDAAEGFLARARIASFHQDYRQTEAMLKLASGVRPQSYKAQIELAQFYLDREHPKEWAVEALGRSALLLDSGRIDAYCVLAALYAGRKDWGSLEGVLSSAAGAVPDDMAPSYRAAERLLSDEPGRAERYLRSYLAQEPEGNEPSAVDARRKLNAIAARNGGAN
jgi:hypothetical protein